MSLEQQKAKEAREAIEHLRELRSDPDKFQAWADRVLEGWLRRKD